VATFDAALHCARGVTGDKSGLLALAGYKTTDRFREGIRWAVCMSLFQLIFVFNLRR
jgi:hypothetical protein